MSSEHEIERFRRDFPCDGLCVDSPEEDCSRHGRRPKELWAMIVANERMIARLRAALTELVTHGDLTPAGRIKLEQIIGGDR